MIEKWKYILNTNKTYQVSNLGNVKSLKKSKTLLLKKTINNFGYETVSIYFNNKMKTVKVHRLVGFYFIENPKGLKQINHKNEIKHDNRYINLEWCNNKYNVNYGTANKRRGNKLSVSVNQLDMDGNFIKNWVSISSAKREGFNTSHIISCCKGRLNHHKYFKWEYND